MSQNYHQEMYMEMNNEYDNKTFVLSVVNDLCSIATGTSPVSFINFIIKRIDSDKRKTKISQTIQEVIDAYYAVHCVEQQPFALLSYKQYPHLIELKNTIIAHKTLLETDRNRFYNQLICFRDEHNCSYQTMS